MAEIALGTAVLVWQGSPATAEAALFGRAGSSAVVAIAMALVVVAMFVDGFSRQLSRTVLITTSVLVALAVAGVGVIAIETLVTDPGVGFLLGFGWILTFPVDLAITRSVRPNN